MKRNLWIAAIALLLVAGSSFTAARAAAPATMNVGTYNIWCGVHDDGPLPWKVRCQRIAALIRFHDYDIIGMQEVRPEQMADLRTALPSSPPSARAAKESTRASTRRYSSGPTVSRCSTAAPSGCRKPPKRFHEAGMPITTASVRGSNCATGRAKKSSSISTRTSTTWALWHATRAQS